MLKKILDLLVKNYFLLIFILLFKLLSLFLLLHALNQIQYDQQNLFIFELLGVNFRIPSVAYMALDIVNIYLIWLVSYPVFKKKYALIPALIYAISPWSGYLSIAGSHYIFLLFFILFFVCVTLSENIRKSMLGYFVLASTILIMFISSWMNFFILPIILTVLYYLGFISLEKLRRIIMILLIPLVLFFILIFIKSIGFRNVLANDVTIFNGPELLNAVNNYQGASREKGVVYLSKISENRYVYIGKFVILKTLKNFAPSTYFTSQEKLLGFSFSPPIYYGFIIPFTVGLWMLLKIGGTKKTIYLLVFLMIPSIFSKQLVDLNRLVLIEPVIIFIISFGIIELWKSNRNKIKYMLLGTTLLLIAFQSVSVISDISIREHQRYVRYYDKNLELGKQ